MDACRTPGQALENFRVSCVHNAPLQRVWMANDSTSPIGFACSEIHLQVSAPVEAVVWAVYSVEERVKWDSSFRKYESICAASPQEKTRALCDCLYVRAPGPPTIRDRDMVQYRYLLRLGDGFAILNKSCSDEVATELGRPPADGREHGAAVRAVTLLSGYTFTPKAEGGVLVCGLTQVDVRGGVPQWAQSFGLKLGKKRLIEWAKKLENHCNQQS